MATIHDVAKLAQVSPSTISKYNNKSGYIAPDKRERIHDAIEELNYRPNKNARHLKTRSSDQVAVILPNVKENLYNDIFIGINRQLHAEGFRAVIFTTNDYVDVETEILALCTQGDYAGIIICTCQPDRTDLFEKIGQQLPLVFVHRMPQCDNVNFVGFDQTPTIFHITDRLLKCGFGPIALYTNQAIYSCEHDCQVGFLRACEANGLNAEDARVYSYPFSKESAYRKIMHILDDSNCPKVFLASSRTIADAIAEVAYLKGIAIKKELFIITLGEESWYDSVFFADIISTFRPAQKAGESAAAAFVANFSSPVVFEKVQLKLKDEFPCSKVDHYLLDHLGSANITSDSAGSLRIMFPKHELGADALKCICSQYSKQRGVDVSVDIRSYNEICELYMSGQCEHDLLAVDVLWLPHVVARGLLDDLKGSGIPWRNIAERQVPDFFVQCAAYESKVYGIPFSYGTELLYYRQDLFENPQICADFYAQYKIDLAPPTDWFSFNLIAKYFTKAFNPKSPTTFGTTALVYSAACADLYNRIWAYGGKIFDSQGNVCLYSEENIRAYKSYAETLLYANPEHFNTFDDFNGINSFIAGDVAMIVTFCSNASEIVNRTRSSVVGKIAYAPVPGKYSVVAGWCMGINQRCKQKKQAEDFIKWFSSEEVSMAYTILGGTSPDKNIYQYPEIKNACPWMDLAFQSYANCRPRSSVIIRGETPINPMEIEAVIFSPIHEYLESGQPLEQLLKQAQNRLMDVFEQNGFPQKRGYPDL